MAIPCLVIGKGVGAVFYFLFQRSAVQRGNAVDAVVSIVDSKIRESSSFDLAVLTTVEGGGYTSSIRSFYHCTSRNQPKEIAGKYSKVSVSITYFVE